MKKVVVGVMGAALMGFALLGWNFFGYGKTAVDKIRKEADDRVPVSMKIDNLERVVRDELRPEISKYMRLIAVQEVDVKEMDRKVAQREATMKDAKRQILALNESLKKDEKEYVFDGQSFTAEQVRNDLGNKVTKFKLASESLAREKELLKARQEALKTNASNLEKMIAARQEIETQVEFLKTRVETQKAEEAVGLLDIDTSKMAEARKLIEQLNKKLDVDEKVRAAEGRLQTQINVPEKKEIRDVSAEVEDLFGDEAKSKTDL
jgi:hypothetical protein